MEASTGQARARDVTLTLQYFHIFEFSSSLCLFGFGRFRCALVFFNTYFVCVTERERVYVSICVLWRKGNVRRCACDTYIERCECANDHA